ncbi:MAG: flavodoxin domain-containing protein [Streptosporangiaceae bacterium]
MRVLVVYATKHGSTRGIAERIAGDLATAGHKAQAHRAAEAGDLYQWDAFVIGSATYLGHWRKEATHFVRKNRAILASRPVWLFSSGPLAATAVGENGDLGEAADRVAAELAAEPTEINELSRVIGPVEHRVFSGALDPATLDTGERLMRRLPAGAALLPEGDFRDWATIDEWAAGIAGRLTGVEADEARAAQ